MRPILRSDQDLQKVILRPVSSSTAVPNGQMDSDEKVNETERQIKVKVMGQTGRGDDRMKLRDKGNNGIVVMDRLV